MAKLLQGVTNQDSFPPNQDRYGLYKVHKQKLIFIKFLPIFYQLTEKMKLVAIGI